MEFKRCPRCGNFFVTEGEVCNACAPKDRLDLYKVQSYFEENSDYSVDNIAIDTGVSVKNVTRYLNNSQNFPNININL